MVSVACCAKYIAIVRNMPQQRTHKCINQGRKRDGPRDKSAAALKTAKAAWLKQPQGMDISSVRRIFKIAERAVNGFPLEC